MVGQQLQLQLVFLIAKRIAYHSYTKQFLDNALL